MKSTANDENLINLRIFLTFSNCYEHNVNLLVTVPKFGVNLAEL